MVSQNIIHHGKEDNMSKFVRNGVVNMDWREDCFFESKEDGFVAAVQEYNTPRGVTPLLFMDKHIMIVANEQGEPCSVDELYERVAKNYDSEEEFTDEYEDDIVFMDDEDALIEEGFTQEQIDDVNNRFSDLSSYFADEYYDNEGNVYHDSDL